jgi:ring-1,2-phenylacetyl-CoA epoxidase subunit PaaD
MTPAISREKIWDALDEVPDPELPVVSLVELGIIREVDILDESVQVTMTPTFSGCPAYEVMAADIEACVQRLGIPEVQVHVSHDPPWTSEWITEPARQKLKAVGLVPPPRHSGDFIQVLIDPVACPHCNSENTSLQNSFGTTPCRMIYTCNNCLEPFELFKPL